MKYARESYSVALWHEMKPMLHAHHAELSTKVKGPFDPNVAFYKTAEHMLRIFTMRKDERLVGYQIYFILGDPHSFGRVQAVQDILYVEPASRQGMAAYKFMNWCVLQLKEEADVIVQRISARHDFGKLFERMGFQLEDLTYCMEVA